MVYSVFINFESFLGVLLECIPFYFFFKILFLLYLFLPQFNGASLIYEKILKHIFNKYENHITDFSSKLVKKLTVVLEENDQIKVERNIDIFENIKLD